MEIEDLALLLWPALEAALHRSLAAVAPLNPFLRRSASEVGEDPGPGTILLACAFLNLFGQLTAPPLPPDKADPQRRSELAAGFCLAVPTTIMMFWGTFVMHRSLWPGLIVLGTFGTMVLTMILAARRLRLPLQLTPVVRRLVLAPAVALSALLFVQGLRSVRMNLGLPPSEALALQVVASAVYYGPFIWAPRIIAAAPLRTTRRSWLLRYLVFLVGLTFGLEL